MRPLQSTPSICCPCRVANPPRSVKHAACAGARKGIHPRFPEEVRSMNSAHKIAATGDENDLSGEVDADQSE